MVSLTVPYVIPLILGMTYDARNSRAGVDIFDMKYVDDPQVTNFEREESLYTVTNSMSELLKALDVSGDLSLKIKTGMVDAEGKGSYIKNERDFKNRIEILTRLKYTSKTKFFKADAKPRENWAKVFSTGVLGTHYVSSITYGAELVASARFVVHNSSDTQEVKGEVEAALGSGGTSAANLVAKGKLEDLQKKLQGKANLEISYYGTVPLKSIPNTIEGLRTLVNNFKEQIEETDLKEGIPMSVDLTPLTALADPEDRDQFQFLKDRNLVNKLAEFEEQLDEMRQSRMDLTGWVKALPYDLDEHYEREIGYLLKNITLVTQVFYEVVWKMDLMNGPEQLKPAFDAYNYDGEGTYRRFDKLVRRLRAKLDPLIKRGDVASDTYIQWGNKNCTAHNAVVLYEGFTISSTEEGIGGTAQYECTPRSVKKGYELTDNKKKSHLAGIRYTKLEKLSNPFHGSYAKKIAEKGVACAKCYTPDSASVAMFSATAKCPLTWEVMYRGYLMSSRKQYGHTTEYICLDEEPSEPYEMDSRPSGKDTLALTVVHSEGSLPKETYKEGALIRCVLCAMKSNQLTF